MEWPQLPARLASNVPIAAELGAAAAAAVVAAVVVVVVADVSIASAAVVDGFVVGDALVPLA